MTTTEKFVQPTSFEGIGCASIENLDIPTGGGAFYRLSDGDNRLRFLQGPVGSWVSQKWGEDKKPIGDKKKYAYDDPEAKKDPEAKLVLTYLVYYYKDDKVMLLDITQPSLQTTLQKINEMQSNMSAFDINIVKTPKPGTTFSDYKVIQGESKPFTNAEVIAQVMEKNILQRISSSSKSEEFADASEEAAINAEVEAKEKAANTPAKEAEEVFS